MAKSKKNMNETADASAISEEAPSKSAKKRESAALQKLGEELAALSPAARAELDLPEELREALDMHDRIRDREGARRQRQYIGRIMRTIDVTPIASALAMRKNLKSGQVAAFHQAEKTRDAILAIEEERLAAYLREIASDMAEKDITLEDLSRLTHLARDTSLTGEERRKRSRELFRYLANAWEGEN